MLLPARRCSSPVVLLAAFVLGLGVSITLAQSALTLLALLWLARLCSRPGRDAARWPLSAPGAGVRRRQRGVGPSRAPSWSWRSTAKSFGSSRPSTSSAQEARLRRAPSHAGSSVLALVVAGAGYWTAAGGALPGPGGRPRLPRWLYTAAAPAPADSSASYMTLGVLSLALLVKSAAVALRRAAGRGRAPPGSRSFAGPASDFTRGACIGRPGRRSASAAAIRTRRAGRRVTWLRRAAVDGTPRNSCASAPPPSQTI